MRRIALALALVAFFVTSSQAAPGHRRYSAKQLLSLLKASLKRTATVEGLAPVLGLKPRRGQELPLVAEELGAAHPALAIPGLSGPGDKLAVLRAGCTFLGIPCEVRLGLPAAALEPGSERARLLRQPAAGMMLLVSAASARGFPLARVERLLRGLDLGVYLSAQLSPCDTSRGRCYRRKYLVPALKQSRAATLLLELKTPAGPVTAIQLITEAD